MNAPVLVTGAGGFIGVHLVADLLLQGHAVHAVDQKPLTDWWQKHPSADNRSLDMKDLSHCRQAVTGCEHVYNRAADIYGPMGALKSGREKSPGCRLPKGRGSETQREPQDRNLGRR